MPVPRTSHPSLNISEGSEEYHVHCTLSGAEGSSAGAKYGRGGAVETCTGTTGLAIFHDEAQCPSLKGSPRGAHVRLASGQPWPGAATLARHSRHFLPLVLLTLTRYSYARSQSSANQTASLSQLSGDAEATCLPRVLVKGFRLIR
jgi:hypothetical protein